MHPMTRPGGRGSIAASHEEARKFQVGRTSPSSPSGTGQRHGARCHRVAAGEADAGRHWPDLEVTVSSSKGSRGSRASGRRRPFRPRARAAPRRLLPGANCRPAYANILESQHCTIDMCVDCRPTWEQARSSESAQSEPSRPNQGMCDLSQQKLSAGSYDHSHISVVALCLWGRTAVVHTGARAASHAAADRWCA